MSGFLQALISGLLLGGLYALIAIGMTFIFGVIRFINAAHGSLMMIAMYITFWMYTLMNVHPFLALPVVMAILFVMGVLIQNHLITPLQNVDSIVPQNQLLLSFALGIALMNAALLLWTANYRSIPIPLAKEAITLNMGDISVYINTFMTISFAIAILLILALFVFLWRTDTGRSIRAVSQNRHAALLMGINVNRMMALSFGIAVALAGAAGALLAPVYYVFPQVGIPFTARAFILAVLGGMGNIIGAIVAGLVLGLSESLGVVLAGQSWREFAGLLVFILVLVFKPSGLLGTRVD